MAHRICTYAMLSILLYLIACTSGDCGCSETDIVNPVPDDGGDGQPTLVMDIYRCGTQFRSVQSSVKTEPVFTGEGGIVLTFSVYSGRLAPVFTGFGNNLNQSCPSKDVINLFGEGLTPDQSGLIAQRSIDAEQWQIPGHNARGGFTDGILDVAVTDKGEVVGLEDGRAGWHVVFETPGEAGLYALAKSSGYVTAVGAGGVVYRNENPDDYSSWLDESIDGAPDFRDIAWKTAPDPLGHIVFAVGGREVWKRSDGSWERIYEDAPGDLYGIGGEASRSDFWAVGSNGTIVYYDGSTWEETDLGADVELRSVTHTGTYACGNDGAVYFQKLNGEWIDLGYANTDPLNDIDGLSTGEVYATIGDSLMLWNGDRWTGLASPGYQLTSISAAAGDRIWIVARDEGGIGNFVWMWNGSTFQFGQQSSMDRFNSIWCDDAGDTVFVATDYGYVHKWPPSPWEWMEADPQHRDLLDVWGSSAHDVFAVGADGLIVHYDGSGWTEMASGVTDALRAIDQTIAVGDNGAITLFDGSSWRAEDAGVATGLNAVCYIDENEIWAVGNGGVVIRYNGSDWIRYQRALYTVDLMSVWGPATDDVWFGGRDGYLLKLVP
jgi:hypothetical protein